MPFNSYEPGAPGAPGDVPLCVPHLGGREWDYVKECLDTNFVSSVGPFVARFEQQVAARVGVAHGVATVTGTAALHIALIVAGVKAGDEVLVSTLTFIAPVNAIRYIGAIPVFIDAEPTYWQMDRDSVEHFLERECDFQDGELRNRKTGRRVAAIVPVHILGHPVDIASIAASAHRYNVPVIEDATESLGALYRGKAVGSLGDIACFSFNGNKLITTGGGGMIVTDDSQMARRAKYLTTQAKDDPVEFVHGQIGYNYRLTNVAAALGCAQLERLDAHLDSKRRIARGYTEGLDGLSGIRVMQEAPWARSAWWLSTILVDQHRFGCDRRALMAKLTACGIQSRPLWQPVHRSPAHADLPATACPTADALNATALSLPSSVGLTELDQQRVIDVIRRTAQH